MFPLKKNEKKHECTNNGESYDKWKSTNEITQEDRSERNAVKTFPAVQKLIVYQMSVSLTLFETRARLTRIAGSETLTYEAKLSETLRLTAILQQSINFLGVILAGLPTSFR